MSPKSNLPEDAAAYTNRGLAKYELEDYEGAIADYDRAIELKPKFAEAYYNRGVAKGFLGDHEGAIADFALAYKNRGTVKFALRDERRAKADRARAQCIDSTLRSRSAD